MAIILCARCAAVAELPVIRNRSESNLSWHSQQVSIANHRLRDRVENDHSFESVALCHRNSWAVRCGNYRMRVNNRGCWRFRHGLCDRFLGRGIGYGLGHFRPVAAKHHRTGAHPRSQVDVSRLTDAAVAVGCGEGNLRRCAWQPESYGHGCNGDCR